MSRTIWPGGLTTTDCIIKKPEQYATSSGEGPWRSYRHDPHLFSLLSRTSSLFFFFEPGFEDIPEERRPTALSGIEVWSQTLDMEIGGSPVRGLLETTTPRELTDLVAEHKPVHWPLLKMMAEAANNESALWYSMYLRTLQYEKHYRGVVERVGNVVHSVFCSRLSQEEDKFLQAQLRGIREDIRKRMNI